jgi:prepilin-type N-terminal cleavage/methylation domain-containing protein
MKHKRGFTIIELMVVVSIIALLTAILLPSLDAARRMAKQVVCSTSLKGIGLGWRMYLDDYPKQIPPAVEGCQEAAFPLAPPPPRTCLTGRMLLTSGGI